MLAVYKLGFLRCPSVLTLKVLCAPVTLEGWDAEEDACMRIIPHLGFCSYGPKFNILLSFLLAGDVMENVKLITLVS